MIALVCLATLSCLPCTLFCSCLCKFAPEFFDALSQALCNLSLAFLADFTLSDSTALTCEFDYWPLAVGMLPTKVCPQCKVAVPLRRKTCERCDHVFRSKRKAECDLREKAIKRVKASPKNKTAASHVVQIHKHVCFARSQKNGQLIMSPYQQETL